MFVDNKLTFKLQVSQIQKKISRGVGILHKLSYFCNKKILLNLYYSLIYSYVTQNFIIWGGISNNKLNSIQTSINKALRAIHNVKYIDYVPNTSF